MKNQLRAYPSPHNWKADSITETEQIEWWLTGSNRLVINK